MINANLNQNLGAPQVDLVSLARRKFATLTGYHKEVGPPVL